MVYNSEEINTLIRNLKYLYRSSVINRVHYILCNPRRIWEHLNYWRDWYYAVYKDFGQNANFDKWLVMQIIQRIKDVKTSAFPAATHNDRLMLAAKVVKSQKSHIWQCTVWACFILEAKTEHENTGKYVLIIKIKCNNCEIKKVESFKYLRSTIPIGNVITNARNHQSVSLSPYLYRVQHFVLTGRSCAGILEEISKSHGQVDMSQLPAARTDWTLA
jgi:hypothetical protein